MADDPLNQTNTTTNTTTPVVGDNNTVGSVNTSGTVDTNGVPLTHVTPGQTAGTSQVNVQDYTGQLAHDPAVGMSDEMILSGKTPTYSQEQIDAGTMQDQQPLNPEEYSNQAQTVSQSQTATAAQVDPREAVGYDASTTLDQTQQNDMQSAQGTMNDNNKVNIQEIDTEAIGRGETETGKALNTAAILDLNDIDSRATLKGQIDILQEEFKDEDGNPTIPPWASGLARQVQKIAAFKGITGTAATEALSNALLESSIKIAEQDAKFFQTVSLENLSNQQQSVINKANVLANMDIRNLDARTTAAVENAKNFMQMDLANLSNEQQAQLINTQQRFQSILEDAKAINASRLFGAESENDLNKFYDTLNSTLGQFNASQLNAMSQFNATEENSMSKFNSELANLRDQFYRTMAYNVDLSNAEWRRSIATTENQMEFEAAAFDVKNAVNISQEALNQLWDRSDALLDYIWKSAENELDRDRAILIAQIQAKAGLTAAEIQAEAGKTGILDVVGSIAGALLGKWL